MNLGGLGPAALVVALGGATAAVVLAGRGRSGAAGRALGVSFAGLSIAVVVLAVALVTVDGSLVYVADHTSRSTPWAYRLAGLWGGMAGSLLLWTWMAAAWALLVGRLVRRRTPELAGGVTAVLGAYVALFSGLLVAASQPFDRLAVPAIEGAGLNPVLLHPAMLYHPPLLYAGAVGLVVPFALAMAGRMTGAWLLPAVQAARVSLVLLSAGLLTGAHWAYVELGWGGYWAWDPVENGGLLPWLAGVAFVHAAVVAARRHGAEPSAGPAGLAALAFGLGLLGSFLTRSGASESVHAFAEARAVGWVLGVALAVVAVGTVVVLVRRRPPDRVAVPWAITANTVLLVGLVVVIGFGTIFPVLARWVTGDRVVVTGRYFALVGAPFAVAVLALIGVGPVSLQSLRHRLRPAVVGLLAAGVTALWFADRRPLAVLVVGLAAAAAALTVAEWRRRPRARWPLAHLGVAVLLAGVAGTSTGTSVTATLGSGEALEVRGYTLSLAGVGPATAPDGGRAAEARVQLRRGDDVLAVLRPVALLSPTGQRVSVAALRSTPLGDVQVALRAVGEGATTVIVDVSVLPLMQLVWWGGLLVVAGLCVSAVRPDEVHGGRAEAAGDERTTMPTPMVPG